LLLNIEKEYNLLKTWLNGLDFSLTLLFRGSDLRYSNANFTRLVGNQSPTLHVIKSEHDHIFGGCAFEKYPTGDGIGKRDDKSFLFQLHPNQVKLKNNLKDNYINNNAIRSYNNSLTSFGANSDFMHIKTGESCSKSIANLATD
jgi:hypothetical protein